MVDEHSETAAGFGMEVTNHTSEVVDATEVLHDHALDAQVVTPDALHQFRIMASLDVDAARRCDAGGRVGHGDRPGRRTAHAVSTGGDRRTDQPDRRAVDQEA